jgi:hypothetical protein
MGGTDLLDLFRILSVHSIPPSPEVQSGASDRHAVEAARRAATRPTHPQPGRTGGREII